MRMTPSDTIQSTFRSLKIPKEEESRWKLIAQTIEKRAPGETATLFTVIYQMANGQIPPEDWYARQDLQALLERAARTLHPLVRKAHEASDGPDTPEKLEAFDAIALLEHKLVERIEAAVQPILKPFNAKELVGMPKFEREKYRKQRKAEALDAGLPWVHLLQSLNSQYIKEISQALYYKKFKSSVAREDYDHVTQEKFPYAFCQVRSQPEKRPNIGSFVRKVLTNAAIDYLRKRDNRRIQTESLEVMILLSDTEKDPMYILREGHNNEPGPHELLEKEELSARIKAALEQLPDQVRNIYYARYFMGMGYEEIASLFDIPSGTVKSHLHRGKSFLKKLLTDFEPPAKRAAPDLLDARDELCGFLPPQLRSAPVAELARMSELPVYFLHTLLGNSTLLAQIDPALQERIVNTFIEKFGVAEDDRGKLTAALKNFEAAAAANGYRRPPAASLSR